MQPEQPHSTGPARQLQQYEGYLASDPSNPGLLASVIEMALSLGEHARAQRHAAAAIALHPDDPAFQALLANVLLAQRDWQGAAEVFETLLASYTDVHLAYNLAYAYVWQGRHAEAYALLAPYGEQAELAPAAVTLLVRCLHHLGQLDQAVALLQANSARCEADPVFLGAASVALLDAGDVAEADRLSALALASGKRPVEALLVAGTLTLGRNTDAALASAYFEEALAKKPDEGRSWAGLGLASMLNNDLGRAAEQLDKALAFMPGHIGTWHTLAWCKIFTGDLAGAEAIFQHALGMDRNFGDSHGGLAVVQAMQGQRALAELSIKRALGLDPDSMSAKYAQMVLSGAASDPARFREMSMGLLATRRGPFGQNMAEMVKQHVAR